MAYSQYLTIDKDTILNYAFPVGSLYFSMTDVNPKNLLGGEWKAITKGYYLYSVKSNGTTTENISAGNYYQNSLVKHDHGSIPGVRLTMQQIPSHNHMAGNQYLTTSTDGDHTHTQQGYWTMSNWWGTFSAVSRYDYTSDPIYDIGIQSAGNHSHDSTVSLVGNTEESDGTSYGKAHNHTTGINNSDEEQINPLFTSIYIWERTA